MAVGRLVFLAFCAVGLLGAAACDRSQSDRSAPMISGPGSTTVATWPDGRSAAVSLTFDDGSEDHVKIVAPALDRRGLKGTFNVIPGSWRTTPDLFPAEFAAMAHNGHELASHTMHHRICVIRTAAEDPGNANFHSLDELSRDCAAVKAVLAAFQPDRPVVTFCYPHGQWTRETAQVLAAHFLSARLSTAGPSVNPPSPPNMYALLSCDAGNDGEGPTGWARYDYAYRRLTEFRDAAVQAGGWVIEEYHDISAPAYGALSADAFEKHLDDLAADVQASRLWVATQGEVARYIRSRDAAEVKIIAVDDSQIELTVDDGLPEAVFDVPLTLSTKIPASWAARLSVTHAGQPLAATVSTAGQRTRAVYAAPADGGTILIRASAP